MGEVEAVALVAEIEEMHTASHAAMFKNSTMRVQLGAFKEVGPDLGVMHVKVAARWPWRKRPGADD